MCRSLGSTTLSPATCLATFRMHDASLAPWQLRPHRHHAPPNRMCRRIPLAQPPNVKCIGGLPACSPPQMQSLRSNLAAELCTVGCGHGADLMSEDAAGAKGSSAWRASSPNPRRCHVATGCQEPRAHATAMQSVNTADRKCHTAMRLPLVAASSASNAQNPTIPSKHAPWPGRTTLSTMVTRRATSRPEAASRGAHPVDQPNRNGSERPDACCGRNAPRGSPRPTCRRLTPRSRAAAQPPRQSGWRRDHR